MTYPKKLYKYQPFTLYSLKNLKNNCLYFNHPEDFNDPYDTTQEIYIKDLNTTSAKDLYFRQDPKRVIFELIEHYKANANQIIYLVGELSNSFSTFKNKLVNIYGCGEYELSDYISRIANKSTDDLATLSNHVTSLFYDSMNITVKNSLEQIRHENVMTKGVCCFSEEVDNLLMWSYYADGHKGFVLEFDTSYEPFTKLHKVNYVDQAPVVDANNIFKEDSDHTGIVASYLATKYLKWSHEKEWRILHINSRQEYTYKANALSAIYFGSKIPFHHLEILALIIKGQHAKCRFFQMIKNEGEFHVTPKEITYKSFQESKIVIYPFINKRIEQGERDIDILSKEINLEVDKIQLDGIIQAIIDDYDSK